VRPARVVGINPPVEANALWFALKKSGALSLGPGAEKLMMAMSLTAVSGIAFLLAG